MLIKDFWKHLWIYINKQNGDWVKFGVVQLFLFLPEPKWIIRKLWPSLQDYRWKTDVNSGLWKYFAVQKSSFL